MSRFLLLVAVILSLYVATISAAVPADLITNLPGIGTTLSPQYSGLLPVDKAGSAFLHYWLVLASGSGVDPKTAPLTVWLNGGPGCSSLDGFMYEHGPFKFTGQYDNNGVPLLRNNPNTWASVSNLLYIESPFGVGYSYAKNSSTTNNDDTTSQNLYGFLLNFFAAYPEYSANEFFITGESYAGFYVPQFALRVYEGNQAGNPKVNLIGFAVGNGCVGEGGSCGGDTGDRTNVNFYYGHGMISQPAYQAIIASCGPYINGSSSACNRALDSAYNQVGNIWIYDVYDVCGNEVVAPHPPTDAELSAKSTPRAPNNPLLERGLGISDPVQCTELASSLGNDWLNHPAVRKAIHVDTVPITSNWTVCAGIDYSRDTVSLIPRYPMLIDNFRVLIFSGDADACVPWTGSEEWTRLLGYKVKTPWSPWTVSAGGNTWTAGFSTEYDTAHGFSYYTIKHAGHMVPQYEPEAALYFFSKWLKGSPL